MATVGAVIAVQKTYSATIEGDKIRNDEFVYGKIKYRRVYEYRILVIEAPPPLPDSLQSEIPFLPPLNPVPYIAPTSPSRWVMPRPEGNTEYFELRMRNPGSVSATLQSEYPNGIDAIVLKFVTKARSGSPTHEDVEAATPCLEYSVGTEGYFVGCHFRCIKRHPNSADYPPIVLNSSIPSNSFGLPTNRLAPSNVSSTSPSALNGLNYWSDSIPNYTNFDFIKTPNIKVKPAFTTKEIVYEEWNPNLEPAHPAISRGYMTEIFETVNPFQQAMIMATTFTPQQGSVNGGSSSQPIPAASVPTGWKWSANFAQGGAYSVIQQTATSSVSFNLGNNQIIGGQFENGVSATSGAPPLPKFSSSGILHEYRWKFKIVKRFYILKHDGQAKKWNLDESYSAWEDTGVEL